MMEFALIAPVLLLVFCGIFEFGNLLMTQIQLQNGVREGARYAALSACAASDTQIQTEVRDVSNGRAITTSSSYSPSPCTACPGVAGVATVTVVGNYTYTPITPIGALVKFFSGTFGTSIALTSRSTLNNEECA